MQSEVFEWRHLFHRINQSKARSKVQNNVLNLGKFKIKAALIPPIEYVRFIAIVDPTFGNKMDLLNAW